ncbi:MAG: BatD family protein, partial [Muribaculaceae bacterium]|nr:BatD family protein [Muribaculaceae bacterium]
MRPRKKHILFLMMLMLFAMASEAATVRLDVQAGRGRREIGVGELFYITYEVSNSEKAPEKPASVPGGKVMYFDRTGQSSSFTSVNGKT